MNVPCKDCPDRHELCHSKCERYIAFRAERDAECERRKQAVLNRYVADAAKERRVYQWMKDNRRLKG